MLTQLSRESRAAWMLLLATAAWGFSFTWIKAAGDGINAASGEGPRHLVGPLLVLAIRFTSGAIIWLGIDSGARRGWSGRSVGRGLVLGTLLWAPMTAQVIGLDRTSEAVSAFLTSLTVVFVPLIMTFVLREPPPLLIWIAVALASGGIWMMTEATPEGFGVGEALGLAGAVGFSAHIITYNRLIGRDSVARMTVAQFGVIGLASWLLAAIVGGLDVWQSGFLLRALGHGLDRVDWTSAAGVLGSPWVALNMLLALVVSTIFAFGIVFRFQPRVTPTRAALIYLAEPIVAAAFAYLTVGRALGPIALAGAALILFANGVAESKGLVARRIR